MSPSTPLQHRTEHADDTPRSCCAARDTASATATAQIAIDPICSMQVDPATTPHRALRAGIDYHFCSAYCRQEFIDSDMSA